MGRPRYVPEASDFSADCQHMDCAGDSHCGRAGRRARRRNTLLLGRSTDRITPIFRRGITGAMSVSSAKNRKVKPLISIVTMTGRGENFPNMFSSLNATSHSIPSSNCAEKYILDPEEQRAPSDSLIRLAPGQSLTIPPRTIHQFWGEEGSCWTVSGEVSSVCDDWQDNYFLEEMNRFPEIIEDESRRDGAGYIGCIGISFLPKNPDEAALREVLELA